MGAEVKDIARRAAALAAEEQESAGFKAAAAASVAVRRLEAVQIQLNLACSFGNTLNICE